MEKYWESGAVGRITCQFTIISERKTRGAGVIDRITYKFTITLNARRAFIEKTYGI